MSNNISKETLKFIIRRILDNAKDSVEESKSEKDDFCAGKCLAYYEVLDTIKNELTVREEDLKEYGLDFDLENYCLSESR